MDIFTEAYITCALWAMNDESDESGGNPLDDNYGVGDIHPFTLARMIADCERFQEDNADDIATYPGRDYSPEEMAGHDFWLTRNGHGSGFWDTADWPKEAGKRLTAACKAFGEVDLYVAGGQIHS